MVNNWKDDSITDKFWKYFEKIIIKKSDYTITTTEEFKNNLFQRTHCDIKKIKVIPNNVNLSIFKKDELILNNIKKELGLNNFFILGYVGSLEEKSWHDPYLYANFIKNTIKLKIPHKFLFITQKFYWQNINKIFRKNNINEIEYILINPDHNEVPKYISIFDIGMFFLPQEKNVLSTKFVEYCAMGIPVLSNNNIPPVNKIITKNNIGCTIKNLDDKNEVINSINKIKNNHPLFSNNAFNYAVSNFSNDIVADKYLKLYNYLLNEQ
jgi:glycosyltransferase involved in cell wall biosynthesis